MSERKTTTGGDPAEGADPGGTRSTKNRGGEAGGKAATADQDVESGDRNAMTDAAPIERQDGGKP